MEVLDNLESLWDSVPNPHVVNLALISHTRFYIGMCVLSLFQFERADCVDGLQPLRAAVLVLWGWSSIFMDCPRVLAEGTMTR